MQKLFSVFNSEVRRHSGRSARRTRSLSARLTHCLKIERLKITIFLKIYFAASSFTTSIKSDQRVRIMFGFRQKIVMSCDM